MFLTRKPRTNLRAALRKPQFKHRTLAIEPLEQRVLLAIDTAISPGDPVYDMNVTV